MFHKGERNGVLWDLSVANVLARRVRNPAKAGFTEHEAEKDPAEVVPLISAFSRPGDVVADFFCGTARWMEKALEMGRNVFISDVEPMWTQRDAERLGVGAIMIVFRLRRGTLIIQIGHFAHVAILIVLIIDFIRSGCLAS